MNTNSQPLISIITVVYNGIADIEATIRSVVFQKYPHIEYIVIDGGSTDGTVDVIKKYEEHITYWVSENDRGIYDAMNKGIIHATGEWIHFRNCGDYFVSSRSVCEMFKEAIPIDVDIIHGDCYHVDDDGYVIGKPNILHASYKDIMPFLHPSTFIRSKLQKKYMFDLQYRSSADYDFFYKCLQMGVKHEYRPIIISYFARGGFSSNWERAFYEDCKIQGNLNNSLDIIKARLYVIKKKMRIAIHDSLLEHIKPLREWVIKKRQNNVRYRKYPLPVPLEYDESIFVNKPDVK